MSQVGLSATVTSDGNIMLVYSTPENGEEYRIVCDPQAYVDFVRVQISVLLPHPGLMAMLFGMGDQ